MEQNLHSKSDFLFMLFTSFKNVLIVFIFFKSLYQVSYGNSFPPLNKKKKKR